MAKLSPLMQQFFNIKEQYGDYILLFRVGDFYEMFFEDAVKVYGVEPDIFDFAIDYCADLEKYSIDYIFKVALRWTEDGCRTVEEAKKLLETLEI